MVAPSEEEETPRDSNISHATDHLRLGLVLHQCFQAAQRVEQERACLLSLGLRSLLWRLHGLIIRLSDQVDCLQERPRFQIDSGCLLLFVALIFSSRFLDLAPLGSDLFF